MNGSGLVLLLDDVCNHLGMKHFVDNVLGGIVAFPPFFAFFCRLGYCVFHLLVETQHPQIEAINAILPVNQWNEDGIDDNAGKDDRKDDVSHEHRDFQFGDENQGLGGQHGSRQSLGVEGRHESQFLLGYAFLLRDGKTHGRDADNEK